MKPENGGMPPRLRAGMKNSTATSGALASSPPMRVMEVLPASRSTRPAARKRVVCTTMWWTM